MDPARDRRAVPDREMRRSKQRNQPVACERRGGEFEHQIEGGGHGFGRERQRVRLFDTECPRHQTRCAPGTRDGSGRLYMTAARSGGGVLMSRPTCLATIGLQPPRDAESAPLRDRGS